MARLELPEGRIAIVGLAKNCGKTTTLNSVSAALAADRACVGLLSIGIDGETSDVLIGTPKPPVHVREGQLVVTADKALSSSTASWEWRESLGIHTPLGEAVLAECRAPGDVVLGGLRHRGDVQRSAKLLLDEGASHVLIDGAYGRVMAASPQLSDSTIISTGAILSDDAYELFRVTSATIRRLELALVEDDRVRHLGEAACESGSVLLGSTEADTQPIALESSSALLGLRRERDAWGDNVDTIAIPGLVSDGVIDELLSLGRSGTLVVPDATSLHCDSRRFRRLTNRWSVRVLTSIRLLGVALNPTSVTGGRIDGDVVARELVAHHPQVIVFNPALGLHSLVDPS